MVTLRPVVPEDLPLFFAHQLDPEANQMAAFTAKDPTNREAFMARWGRMLADSTIWTRTIIGDGQVVGSILTYEDAGHTEVSYWLGREHWGRGYATAALRALLAEVETRPLFARTAKDNIGSLRVLQKCGFAIIGEDVGFAAARGAEIAEYLLKLD